MKAIWIIAKNTFREIIRDRILYGIVVFAFFLIGLSLALGQLSFQEQMKISLDFGFLGIHLSAIILSIFVGSSLVAKEIEKQTVLTLLARPITRQQFLIGKFLGLIGVTTVVTISFGVVLFLVSVIIGVSPQWTFITALYGIFLETLVILAVTLLFGSFSKPTMTVIYALSFFLIGHWLSDLNFFAQKSQSTFFRVFGTFASRALPNLETFNWRSLPVYEEVISWSAVALATMIALGWVLCLLFLTTFIFRKRDFV